SLFACPPPPPPELYPLSLHDALPISAGGRHQGACANRDAVHVRLVDLRLQGARQPAGGCRLPADRARDSGAHPALTTGCDRRVRSEEHTSELQSRENLVCRLLLEKKK